MKKYLPLLFAVLCVLLCGCNGYREIERGYMAAAIGFKSHQNKIDIIIEATSTSDVMETGETRVILSGEGENVDDAFENLKASLVKPVYFEHLGTAIFENSLNDDTKRKICNFLTKTDKVNIGLFLIETPDVDALFNFNSPDGLLGYDIIGLIKNSETQNPKKQNFGLYKAEISDVLYNIPSVYVDDGKLILEEN